MGFQATFVCESRTNVLTQNPECLYGLGRYLRTNETDSAIFSNNSEVIFVSYQKMRHILYQSDGDVMPRIFKSVTATVQ